jgi:Uma2 family endonuclease
MGIPVIDTGPMTVEEFYAFTDGRPDEEKWELIEGEPILNASPLGVHQLIVGNIVFALRLRRRELDAAWTVIPGIGALISNTSRPEPDVMVLPSAAIWNAPGRRDTTEASVLFEVISPSTADRDLRWKRSAYTSLSALTHYVVVAPDAVEVVVFARDRRFMEQRLISLSDTVELTSLGVTLALSDIYQDVPFG